MSLRGRKILVTAGPTREYLDPVRFLTNGSTGRMGYAIAREARRRGARVVLVSGPTCLTPPRGVRVLDVTTSEEMYRETMRRVRGADLVIGAAAVGDFRPKSRSASKIKKGGRSGLRLDLVATRDIMASVGRLRRRPTLVVFALETGRLLANARKKLKRKRADMIVANRVDAMGGGRTSFILVAPGKRPAGYRALDKARAARVILGEAERIHDSRR